MQLLIAFTLQGSFYSFHHLSAVHICLSCIHFVIHSICGILEPRVDMLPICQSFIAQLVEQHIGITEVMGLNPLVTLKFFQSKKCKANCLNCFHTARIISFISIIIL